MVRRFDNSEYTFDASLKTVTITAINPIDLAAFALIVNPVDGIIIFNPRDPTKTGSVATNVLTLTFDTTSMSDSDDLLVLYDDPAYTANTTGLATQATLAAVLLSLQTLDNIVSVNRALVTEDNSAAIKAAVEALAAIVTGGTLDISGTVSISGPVTEANSAAILAAALAIQTATELLDNTVAGNELQVDVITVPADPFGLNADAAVAAGAAGSMQAKLRRLTTDIDAIKTATQALAAIITGGTLDVSGTVTADAGAGWATSGLGLEATLQLIKTATEAVAAIITGGTLDISGTVTADAGNNLNTSALALEATMQSILTGIGQIEIAIEIIDNAISGNEMQVDVLTQPARVATTDSISSKDSTDVIQNGLVSLTPKFAQISASTSGDNTLLAAVTAKKIRVLSLWLVASAAVNIRFESGTSGNFLSGTANLAANGGFVLDYNKLGWFETVSGELLNLILSGAIPVGGSFTYIEV